MFARYLNFVRGVATNWWGRLGVILTTSSFLCMMVMELARLVGLVTSSYAGLVSYMLFPSLFVLGLLLIPIGWWMLKKQTGKSSKELIETEFGKECAALSFGGARLFRTISILTIVNIVFLLIVSTRMLAYMDTAEFCGKACHSVMNPEWVSYQQSPHARVACIECHVGEGAGSLIDSKLNGLWQVVSVTFDLLERPIPTPVHQLRPARETCEKCHWPDKFYGQRLKTITRYGHDSVSTQLFTTLSLKVDIGAAHERSGIHWHIAQENEVRYASVNDEREKIIWTEVRQPDGSYHRYTSTDGAAVGMDASSVRKIDCVDCHNRATHIYELPDRAIDERIHKGILDRSLPFLKREALRAISANYASREAAMEGISNHVNGYYQRNYPDLARSKMTIIDSVVTVLKGIYNRNIHPSMNIEWGTYPSHIGHVGDGGCFRCHNSNMVDEDGNAVSSDCALCHSMLSNGHEDAFQYLRPADTSSLDYQMHLYLQQEFMHSSEASGL
ncbi:MAG: NapC/NirT family cytochrome c [candidate division Zixibacteria bacterium]|nr:NapC/NirT family cytochrome c [candidate division Zixibacteria bacterium]